MGSMQPGRWCHRCLLQLSSLRPDWGSLFQCSRTQVKATRTLDSSSLPVLCSLNLDRLSCSHSSSHVKPPAPLQNWCCLAVSSCWLQDRSEERRVGKECG